MREASEQLTREEIHSSVDEIADLLVRLLNEMLHLRGGRVENDVTELIRRLVSDVGGHEGDDAAVLVVEVDDLAQRERAADIAVHEQHVLRVVLEDGRLEPEEPAARVERVLLLQVRDALEGELLQALADERRELRFVIKPD